VQTVLSQSVCFDVLLKMMADGIHHVAVERSNRIIGLITSHDIVSLQGNAPYYMFKEIVSQQEISGLYPLAQKIPDVIRNLIKEGAKAGHITRMIAILNDHILNRLLTLLEEKMGPPPLPYCWLLMGSEGRREQTFKTDQDNAIIYQDPANEEEQQQAENYFKTFAEKAIDHLVNCGYPLCPGEIMASNLKWRQPLSVWKQYFDSWVAAPDPKELLHSTIFFDFKAGYGNVQLAEELRDHLVGHSGRQDIFLLHLARHSLANRVQLSFIRNFIDEKDGEHKNQLDIKQKAIALFVDFARVLALKHGVKETNTLARLKVLADEEHIKEDIFLSASESYELMMQLRLLHQLEQLENGTVPDNYIDPAHLTELERRMLKDGFSVLERLHSILEKMYPVG
jgi:CBS domain-containing protein